MPKFLPAFALILLSSSSACVGGGSLETELGAVPVEVGITRTLQELSFRVEAHTSDTIADGAVNVIVNAPGADGPTDVGQVRVTFGQGESLDEDLAPEKDVVQIASKADVVVEKNALAGCDGTCAAPFVVVFSAEGLKDEETVELSVTLKAQLVYENALVAPPTDTLDLILE